MTRISMRFLRAIVLSMIVVWVGAATAQAVVINLSTAAFNWDAPIVDATHGAPTSYTVKCGVATGVYTVVKSFTVPLAGAPLVSSIVSAPNTYFCVVTASNAAGESVPSNEVSFTIGLVPNAPLNLRLQ